MKKLFPLLLVSVFWKVSFTPFGGQETIYSMRQDFLNLKEAQIFVRLSPKGSYECKSSRYPELGSCILSHFTIDGWK